MEVRKRSNLWFLLPILLNVIGGVIAYFIIKDDDPRKAKNCLWLGIILTAISFAIFVIPILIGISLMPDFEMMSHKPYL
jgi:4-hydroxybenzoate polyprenyltransferase